ncbi:UDP-N-acetylmuramoyl-L-alanine--D-glutamate ligase [Hyphomicrobiales bacterium 4NK60-0047b]
MIPITVYKDKTVALFGLGITGLSAAAALKAGGADVVVWDENQSRCAAASEAGYEVVNLIEADWSSFDALLLSPGVPLTHPEPHWTVKKAQGVDLPIIGDTELFFEEFLHRGERDRVLVITGTNGKSTTTALTTHILNEAGETAIMGGNIGLGVLDMPDFSESETQDGKIYVLELSSYQIDLTPSLCPTAAGLLNISPDHIDRHGTVEHYAEVKAKIFDNLEAENLAVISFDDLYCQQIALSLSTKSEVLFVSSTPSIENGVVIEKDRFSIVKDTQIVRQIDLKPASHLRGKHNTQNAAFALLLALKVSSNFEGLVQGLATFPGLEHRMQQIATLTCTRLETETEVTNNLECRLLFVNDSKATNAEASEQALKSYADIYWIAGGVAKEGGINGLTSQMGAVRHAFLIGEAADEFAKSLKAADIPYDMCGDMETAVKKAVDVASDESQREAAILLSPAAASFDQYANFEIRGDAFLKIVRSLEGAVMSGPHRETEEA